MQRASAAWVRVARAATAILILAAVLRLFPPIAGGGGSVVTFLSYFTIQSNLIAAAVLLWLAIRPPAAANVLRADIIRGVAVLYLSITCIVFALLLSGASAQMSAALLWTNTVLHQLSPILLFLDWLIVPPAAALTFRRALWWLVYPLAYLVYTLVRGAFIDWYPYPFLTPDVVGGYDGVLAYAAAITVGVLVFMAVLFVSGRGMRRVMARG